MNNTKQIILIIFINIFFVAIYTLLFLCISFASTVDKNLENSEKISNYTVDLMEKLINERKQ